MWTDRQIKGAKPKDRRYRISKPLGVRIQGSLVLDIHTGGTKVFYYQYYRNLKRVLIKIGAYKKTPSSVGWTLEGASDKGREYADLLRRGIDPKRYLDEQELVNRGKVIESERAKRQGTLEQLLESYLAAMEADGKRSHESVRYSLRNYVINPFPQLVNRNANMIEADDIEMILYRMISNGITTHSNRVRSFLSAAFNHGLRQEHNPRRYTKEGTKFNLKYNPVSFVPKQADYERVWDHVISEEEIRITWNKLVNGSLIISLVALLVKLGLATGQRVGELSRLKWADIDFNEQTMTVPSGVSKNKLVHVVPLNEISMTVINSLHELTGEYARLFPGSYKGKLLDGKIMYSATIAKVISEFCKQKKISKFIARDTRRTVKTLMGKAGILKDTRDRIQNHALKDVSSKHYDRYDYMQEKRQGMKVWNDYLELIINPDKKVTHIKRA